MLKSRKICQGDQSCHIHKGYDCFMRQTDMARRYPDDDPLRCLGSHSVALTVGLSMQRHHQHKIPAGQKHQECYYWRYDVKIGNHMFPWDVMSFTSGQGLVCPSSSCYLPWSR